MPTAPNKYKKQLQKHICVSKLYNIKYFSNYYSILYIKLKEKKLSLYQNTRQNYYMREQIRNLVRQESFKQLVLYGIVGAVGLVIDLGVFYLLINKFAVHYPCSSFISDMLGGNMSVQMLDILISNVISSTLAIINNFLLNSYFTFKVTDQKFKRFACFAGIAAIGMIISSLLLTLFIGIMKIDDIISKVLAIFIVAAIQFGINKFFTFKQH
jgi:putative flippase GtrA